MTFDQEYKQINVSGLIVGLIVLDYNSGDCCACHRTCERTSLIHFLMMSLYKEARRHYAFNKPFSSFLILIN